MMKEPSNKIINEIPLEKANQLLKEKSAQQRLLWAYDKFKDQFALTTSFGIQSSVLLHLAQCLKEKDIFPKIIWVDTGYLPKETYIYAEKLIKLLDLKIEIAQSKYSPAHMEAIFGKLWENSSEDFQKYHQIRKVDPLEYKLKKFKILCWATGVRGNQTKHRSTMNFFDITRGKYSLRPLLDWTTKDIYYYMQKNNLPQHPLFEKGYSSVGDWHSSGPDTEEIKGRKTRFGGQNEECGIHL